MKELTTLHRNRNKASTDHFKWRGLPDHPSHENYKKLSKEFVKAIAKAKANHWHD